MHYQLTDFKNKHRYLQFRADQAEKGLEKLKKLKALGKIKAFEKIKVEKVTPTQLLKD